MKKEVKIGILALVTIIGAVWGYSFLKGRNLLTNSYTFYSKFQNVDQLPVSAPVLVSGVQVGTVSKITLDPADMQTVIVQMDVENNFGVPASTIARLISTGLMGQKAIELKMEGPCSGADCAKSGDYLQSQVVTMMQSMLGENTIADVFKGVGTAFDTINKRLIDPNNDGRITSILSNIDDLTEGLLKTSENLNGLIYSTNRNLTGISKNMDGVLGNLEKNNDAIEAILKNAAGFTGQLNESDLKGTINGVGNTMKSADETLAAIEKTLSELDGTLKNFQTISADLKAGKGTMGKLLNNDELYDNLNRTSTNMDLLLQDFRLNPKRYIGSFWLGKKNKEYKAHDDDPAFENDAENK